MESIGGYFSLELSEGESYHPQAIALNTGRNCLEYILRSHNYRKVYIPYYTCGVVMEPFHKLCIPYCYYHINEQLEIAENISLEKEEALLFTNYFGLKQSYVERLARQYGKQLIVDNTQAFYAKPISGVDTFYTCRKFFGVPDGAYLYTDAHADLKLEQDVSYARVSFLMKRLDLGAQAGYADFQEQRKRMEGQPIKRMSNLTAKMMEGIDYRYVAKRRRENYRYLHQIFAEKNQLLFELDEDAVPMVYPYLTNDEKLKQKLIDERIYVPTYWPNVLEWCGEMDLEYLLAKDTCFIPIDQRYGIGEMERIINVILQ